MSHQKNIFAVVIFAFIALIPLGAKAATVSLSPAHVSVHVGEAFTIAVDVNSPGVTAYTIKIDGLFTPKIMRLSTWNYYDATWTALRQPGYDSFDNTRGSLVRTAGYAGGFTGTERFAKATFVGDAVGKGTISLGPNSFIFNADSKNIYTGANQVAVDVLPAIAKIPVVPSAASSASSSISAQHSFDIALELQKSFMSPEEAVVVQVHLSHCSDIGEQLQVPVHYTLTKSDGTVVLDERNVVALNSISTKFTYQPAVNNLAPGTYTLIARVEYPGVLEPAEAKAFFTIQTLPAQAEAAAPVLTFPYIMLILATGIVCASVLILMWESINRGWFVSKHKRKSKD